MKTQDRFISDLHIGHQNVIKFTNSSYNSWEKYSYEDSEGASHQVQTLPVLKMNGGHSPLLEIPEDMSQWNERIKTSWNSIVGVKDRTWILGDVAMGNRSDPEFIWNFLNDLNGEIHIIPGNHDDEFLKHIFENYGGEFNGIWNGMISAATGIRRPKIHVEPLIVKTYIAMPDGLPARKVVMSHYPIYCFDSCGFDATHLFGHIHNMFNQNNDFIEALKNGVWTENPDIQKRAGRACNVGCMLPWIDFKPRTLQELDESFMNIYAGEPNANNEQPSS